MSMTKENTIDSLLTFMNNEIEKDGHLIENFLFFFIEDQRDAVRFMELNSVDAETFQTTLNTCLSRKYISHDLSLGEVRLTETGQQRAISLEAHRDIAESDEMDQSQDLLETAMKEIPETLDESTRIQVEQVFSSLIREIKNSEASSFQKREAQKRLQEFITHPLVNTLLGASAGLLASLIGG